MPRLGFAWQVSDIVSIKGEAYFALTASCVMAGATLDVSIDAGWIWGRLVAGFDALVAWDPFHYLVQAYASVTVGFKIEICVPFLGCARVKFSMSIGADLEIEGPELRGKAKLDLDVTSFTVRFGATGSMPSDDGLAWPEFYDKYLVAGDDRRRVLEAGVSSGGLALPAGGEPEDGSAQRPWRLLPEFVLTTSTRAASTAVNGAGVGGAAGLPLGAGPMKVARIDSDHTVRVLAANGADRTAALRVVPVLGSVPAAVWESHDGPEPPAEAKVRPAAVGATLIAEAVAVGAAVPLPVDDVDPPGTPAPAAVPRRARGPGAAGARSATRRTSSRPSSRPPRPRSSPAPRPTSPTAPSGPPRWAPSSGGSSPPTGWDRRGSPRSRRASSTRSSRPSPSPTGRRLRPTPTRTPGSPRRCSTPTCGCCRPAPRRPGRRPRSRPTGSAAAARRAARRRPWPRSAPRWPAPRSPPGW